MKNKSWSSRDISLQIISRAEPILCGHANETLNYANSGHSLSGNPVHIITYDLTLLKKSGLPLRTEVIPYSPGVIVHRPKPSIFKKVLDGNITKTMAGTVIEQFNPKKINAIISLYVDPHTIMANFAARTGRQFGIKNIVTISKAVGSDITGIIKQLVDTNRIGEAQLILTEYFSSDLLLAVSHYTKNMILSFSKKLLSKKEIKKISEKIVVAYPPINFQEIENVVSITDKEKESILAKYGIQIKNNKQLILYFSRITKDKGILDLIKAYQYGSLSDKTQLIIAGSLEDKSIKKELKNISNITLLEQVKNTDKYILMNSCDVFAFPTKKTDTFTETFGIVLTEKIASGGSGVIVTCKTGGVPEATGNNCLYAEEGNPISLFKKISEALKMSPSEKNQLAKKALIHSKNICSSDSVTSKIFDSILDVIKSRSLS